MASNIGISDDNFNDNGFQSLRTRQNQFETWYVDLVLATNKLGITITKPQVRPLFDTGKTISQAIVALTERDLLEP